MAPSRAYPPDLTEAETGSLLSTIKDWSVAHGLTVRPPVSLVAAEADPHGVLATTVPVTLFPSPFPRSCFEQGKSISKAYNSLYAAIAQDEEFLKGIVQELLEVDDFIAELWQVHLKVKEEGYAQKLSLGIFRSDYMVHQSSPENLPTIKQVEFNTIAASFGGLSSQTSNLHRYLAQSDYKYLENGIQQSEVDLPQNTSTQSIAAGLRFAYGAYTEAEKTTYDPCVLFLVQSPERNIFDQRHLEYELREKNIPAFRLPFSEVLARTSVADTPKRQLLYHLPSNSSKIFEVAVVYFRAGYGPEDYSNESAWKGRLQIERSNAIKCPSVLTQLAGAKKVQQVLATPTSASESAILQRFIKPSAVASEVKSLEDTFTNIYPLDDSPAGLEARKIALDEEKCKGYVLKPQREGGGNNTYRSAIPPFLKSLPESHWKSYILMEIISPPPVQNMILRNGNVEKGGVICELGIYGTCLWNQDTKEIISNEEAGYLLRTKGDQSEEGGVAAGFGSMDSVRLV
ncbi:glutathione synthetase [Coleophoma cylindrospora]|uniref:Glutathione synthetase n=1 Tax=Coleophoma cylindrospora TaxID=1849047 RepID=A0A3D8SEC0_9HELO|nr:glutathione synthetase [Coleophoma cylindrospora]